MTLSSTLGNLINAVQAEKRIPITQESVEYEIEVEQIKPLTVKRLKEILNEIPDDMITDAFVLVYLNDYEVEYVISRTGQYRVVPNLTFTITPNNYGLAATNQGDKSE